MFSNLERIRSRALSFSSDDPTNNLDNLDDLNALESVINENDLQPALKASPLKGTPSQLLKRRRRKHCVHDTSEKLQLLALHDDNVFETGSQDGGPARQIADALPLQRIDLSGQTLQRKSKIRVASTRPSNYELSGRLDRKEIMNNVARLIRERPVTLPTANVKRFDDIDQYLTVYRQRKQERENRRKQILLSRNEDPGEDHAADSAMGDPAEVSRIDIFPVGRKDSLLRGNALLKRLEQQVNRSRNSRRNPWSKGGQNRMAMKELLRQQIEEQRREKLARKAQEEEAAKAETTQASDVDKSGDVKFYEPVEIGSVTVSDTRTEEAIERAFKAIEALGADTGEPSVAGSFTEQWTIESLETNALDPQASSKTKVILEEYEGEPQLAGRLPKDALLDPLWNEDEPSQQEVAAPWIAGDVGRPTRRFDDREPDANENVYCFQPGNSQDRADFVRNWLKGQLAQGALEGSCSDLPPSDEEKDVNVKCKPTTLAVSVSSDDDSIIAPEKASDVHEEEKARSEVTASTAKTVEGTLVEEYDCLFQNLAKDYIEDQAELSGSNVSEDENENSIEGNSDDIIDPGMDDTEEREEDRGEHNRVHIMREIADDDKRLNALRERYLSKLEPTRRKRFRWDEDTVASEEEETVPSFAEQEVPSDNETVSSIARELPMAKHVERSDTDDVYNDNSVEKILNDPSFRLVKTGDQFLAVTISDSKRKLAVLGPVIGDDDYRHLYHHRSKFLEAIGTGAVLWPTSIYSFWRTSSRPKNVLAPAI